MSQVLGRIELRLRALERMAGQGKPVDDLVEEAVERAAMERIAGDLARKRVA